MWLVYGMQVHAVAVIWANALAGLMVLISIILKANPPAKKFGLGSQVVASHGIGSRRLRIAVDMDEVIADSFGKQLSCYNQRTGQKPDAGAGRKQRAELVDSTRSPGGVFRHSARRRIFCRPGAD